MCADCLRADSLAQRGGRSAVHFEIVLERLFASGRVEKKKGGRSGPGARTVHHSNSKCTIEDVYLVGLMFWAADGPPAI